MTKQEMKAHPNSPRSVSSYLQDANLTEEDKVWIAQITCKKGWCEKFNNPEHLTEEEILARDEILKRIKKFPVIKVRILSFSSKKFHGSRH